MVRFMINTWRTRGIHSSVFNITKEVQGKISRVSDHYMKDEINIIKDNISVDGNINTDQLKMYLPLQTMI